MIVTIKELAYNRNDTPTQIKEDFRILPEHSGIGDCIHMIVVKYLESLGLNGKVRYRIMSKEWDRTLLSWRSNKKSFNVWLECYGKRRIFHNNTQTYTALVFKEVNNA